MSSFFSKYGYQFCFNRFVIVSIFGIVTHINAAETPHTDIPQDKVGYSVGYEFGVYLSRLKQQGSAIEMESVLQGMTDAQAGSAAKLSAQEMQSLLDTVKSASNKLQANPNKAVPRIRPARAGRFVDDYAKLNAKREGVVVLPSGVQYEVLKPGTGKQIQANDTINTLYEAKLPNGVVFDSTKKEAKPAQMHLDEVVVPGLKEALLLMQEGAKWRIVVPPKMGFANVGNNMLRNRDLIYELEVLNIEPSTPK